MKGRVLDREDISKLPVKLDSEGEAYKLWNE